MTDSTQTVRTARLGKRQLLYDAALLVEPDEALFAPADADRIEPGSGGTGRAQVVMHRYHGMELVNRHYHRGGMVARLLDDRYFGIRAGRSRSFVEWCMLRTMRKLGLPVPIPVAASVISSGLFYRADLVSLRLPRVQTLADLCIGSAQDNDLWAAVGSVIRRFHDSNVWHADLNARNILVDDDGEVYLIDFDRSRFRLAGSGWRNANLARLRRSLDKFAASEPVFHFNDDNWRALLKGYGGD